MTTFDALSARRSAYVVAARDNGFEEGLRRLLADLYPDNAHFIYELLQNAEDADARQVVFNLRRDGLLVEHDGARLFDLRDIESITSIGQSTKADDATSIGKFGVGFKAVFAYTQTPVIHSGTHSFAIRDLFVPVVVPGGGRPGWTTFWFPFDRPDKPADRAAAEVAHALRELSGTTLLFLNNIMSIASSVFGEEPLRFDRGAIDGNVIEIASSHDMAGPARWYRIAGDVEIDGRPFPVAAAFALEAQPAKPDTAEKPKTRSKGYAVAPVDGQVSIYFPAVKETSGLRFHIHAPFASTVARDSVRDDPGNDALIDGIGTLIAQALPAMRDTGLLTDGLLSALPNADDDLPARYEILRERIIEAFDNQPLTLVASGGHAPGKQLLRSDRNLREALTVKDVRFILGLAERDVEDITGWMPAREGRARAFLDSLDAIDFGPNELSHALGRAARAYENVARYGFNLRTAPWHVEKQYETWQGWTKWLEAKTDEQLRASYIALGTLATRLKASHPYNLTLAKAPLLRVRDGATTRHVPGKEAWLPTAPGLHVDGLVPDSLLVPDDDGDEATKDVTKGARRALRDFYEHAEVQPWDAAAQLGARFETYDLHPASVTARHVDDLRQLKRLLDDDVVEAKAFEGLAFLVAVRRDGERYWAPPRDVYLDQPFIATGLAALYQSHQYRGTPPGRLDPAYASEDFDVTGLADTLDVTRGLSVRPADISHNPKFQKSWSRGKQRAYTRVAQDWQIPNFDLIVATEDEDLLRSLWRTVVFAKASFAEAEFQANMTSPRYALESQLLQSLRHTPWVLDSDGNLRLPTDITVDELAEGLVVPDASPMLQHVGFGRNAAIAVKERRERELQAKALGFESVDVLLEIAEAYQADPESMRAWLRERKNLTLPEGASADPEQRATHAGKNAAYAPERRSEKRMRAVQIQVPGLQSAARAYLTQMYTNDEGVMVCQVCTSAMPFKVGSDYYFEAVQFVKDSTRDLHENRLALCPTCAAKYRHVRDTPLEDLRAELLAHHVGGHSSITIGLMLVGEVATIRFVGKHAIDLQAALKATKGVRSEDDEPEGRLPPDVSRGVTTTSAQTSAGPRPATASLPSSGRAHRPAAPTQSLAERPAAPAHLVQPLPEARAPGPARGKHATEMVIAVAAGGHLHLVRCSCGLVSQPLDDAEQAFAYADAHVRREPRPPSLMWKGNPEGPHVAEAVTARAGGSELYFVQCSCGYRGWADPDARRVAAIADLHPYAAKRDAEWEKRTAANRERTERRNAAAREALKRDPRVYGPIAYDPSHEMVLIPPVQSPHPANFGVWDDSLAAMRRFVLDALARVEQFTDVVEADNRVETRVPVIVNLVPRPDNPHTREAISIASPPIDGGSVVERHMGYLYNHTLKLWGESLHRMAAAASPAPIGCHGWISLRKIKKDAVEQGERLVDLAEFDPRDDLWKSKYWDSDWKVGRHSPFSRAEMLKIGYRIDHIYLDIPLPPHLRKMVDVYVARVTSAG